MNTDFSTKALSNDLQFARVPHEEAAAAVAFYDALQSLLADSVALSYELHNNAGRPTPDAITVTVTTYGRKYSTSIMVPLAAPYLSRTDYAQGKARKIAHELGLYVFLRQKGSE